MNKRTFYEITVIALFGALLTALALGLYGCYRDTTGPGAYYAGLYVGLSQNGVSYDEILEQYGVKVDFTIDLAPGRTCTFRYEESFYGEVYYREYAGLDNCHYDPPDTAHDGWLQLGPNPEQPIYLWPLHWGPDGDVLTLWSDPTKAGSVWILTRTGG